jgi:hypothetical protein
LTVETLSGNSQPQVGYDKNIAREIAKCSQPVIG